MAVFSVAQADIRLINISTRAPIQGGAGDIIAGFIIEGTGTQRVVIRGWDLEAGVDPKLTLQKYPSGDFVTSNDNWKTDSRYREIPSQMTTTFDDIDAALLLDLPAGAYTVTLSSVGKKGIGLVGVDTVDGTSIPLTKVTNISTRAPIQGGAGDIIAGFIIKGTGTQRVVIRGWDLEPGVDPKLTLQKYPSGDFVASNDNWKTDSRYREIPSQMTTTFDDIDAALLLDLPAGAYTVTLSSVGAKGIGLVGVDAITTNTTTTPPSNTTLDFGRISVGSSTTQQITINNETDTPLTVESFSISGPDASDFKVLTPLPFIISPTLGAAKKITVQCTPSKEGVLSAVLQLVTDSLTLFYKLEGFGSRVVQSCSSSDDDCLAKKFAPVVHISKEPLLGGSDVKSPNHPYEDYIPINVNDLTTSSKFIYPKYYHTEKNFFRLLGMDIENLTDELKSRGISGYMPNHYIDFSVLWKEGISAPFRTAEGSYNTLDLHPTVYFRVFRNFTRKYPIAIQYWFFYFYNDWITIEPFVNTNHGGDWESITLFLDKNEMPMEAVYSTHYEANRYSWENVENRNTQPLVFVSHGGHGSYINSGTTTYYQYKITKADDEHQGGGGILTLGEISSVTGESYIVENLKEKSWTEFPGKWGEKDSAPPGPLYRTDAPNEDWWEKAKNKPRFPYYYCSERYSMRIYGTNNSENDATNDKGILSSQYGPWCWASGYVLDRNLKIEGGEQCRPIVPITLEVGCEGQPKMQVDMDLHYHDAGNNFVSDVVEVKGYDGTPMYLLLSGTGYGKKVNFDYEIYDEDNFDDRLSATLSAYSSYQDTNNDGKEELSGLIRQDALHGDFNGEQLNATVVHHSLPEGTCHINVTMTRRSSPCLSQYSPPTEKPTFPTKGYQYEQPRFTDNQDGTIIDTKTGLVWMKDANCFGRQFYNDAQMSVKTLRHGRTCPYYGYTALQDNSEHGDWRLPTLEELKTLTEPTSPMNWSQWRESLTDTFRRVQYDVYWTSNSLSNQEAKVIDMSNGESKVYSGSGRTWAVRGSSSPFTDNEDGTVTDNRTGLIWLKDTRCLGSATWTEARENADKLRSGQCGLSDGSLIDEWRLPTIAEFLKLVRSPQSELDDVFTTILPLCENIQQARCATNTGLCENENQPARCTTRAQRDWFIYWSETEAPYVNEKKGEYAWVMQTLDGTRFHVIKKAKSINVWPVRQPK